MRKIAYIVLLWTITGLLATGDAVAHRVSIFAWVDGDTVHTESKFSGSKMVKDGIVKVFDMEANLLLEGKTDEKGEFSFEVPKRVPLRLELQAGTGHGNEWLITADEIGAGETNEPADPETTASLRDTSSEAAPKMVQAARISREEMEKIVEKAVKKAVDQKLKPVVKILSDMRQTGPKMSDIVGGIGYIIGLVGIGAYFNSRNKKETDEK